MELRQTFNVSVTNSTNLTRPTRPNTTAGTTVDVGKSKLGLKWAQRDVMTLVSNQFKWFCPASFSPVFVVVARPLTKIKWNLWVYFIKFESSEHVRVTMNIRFFLYNLTFYNIEQVGKLLYKTQGNCFKFVNLYIGKEKGCTWVLHFIRKWRCNRQKDLKWCIR